MYTYDLNGNILTKKTYTYTTSTLGTLLSTVNYTYGDDAWGNVVSVKDENGNEITDKTHIAYINPFRYRSYYYDSDTGFYYLNSRYYDPQVGRFINADVYISTGDILGNNMFAYCENNPVMFVDPDGELMVGPIIKFIPLNKFAIDNFDRVLYQVYLKTDKNDVKAVRTVYLMMDNYLISSGKLNLAEILIKRNNERIFGTKKNRGLDTSMQGLAYSFLIETHYNGISTVIGSAYRSKELQDKYFEEGRTPARGGYSMHNYGMAFDFYFYHNMSTVNCKGDMKSVSVIGKSLGLVWGGDWEDKYNDPPHFQSSLCYVKNGKLIFY